MGCVLPCPWTLSTCVASTHQFYLFWFQRPSPLGFSLMVWTTAGVPRRNLTSPVEWYTCVFREDNGPNNKGHLQFSTASVFHWRYPAGVRGFGLIPSLDSTAIVERVQCPFFKYFSRFLTWTRVRLGVVQLSVRRSNFLARCLRACDQWCPNVKNHALSGVHECIYAGQTSLCYNFHDYTYSTTINCTGEDNDSEFVILSRVLSAITRLPTSLAQTLSARPIPHKIGVPHAKFALEPNYTA